MEKFFKYLIIAICILVLFSPISIALESSPYMTMFKSESKEEIVNGIKIFKESSIDLNYIYRVRIDYDNIKDQVIYVIYDVKNNVNTVAYLDNGGVYIYKLHEALGNYINDPLSVPDSKSILGRNGKFIIHLGQSVGGVSMGVIVSPSRIKDKYTGTNGFSLQAGVNNICYDNILKFMYQLEAMAPTPDRRGHEFAKKNGLTIEFESPN